MNQFRRFAIFGTCAFVTLSLTSRAQSQASKAKYSDQTEAERWMQSWIDAPGAVTKPLYLGRFQDPIYFVLKEIGWRPNEGQKGLPTVAVPTGFVTDMASIPRVFWSALRPDGTYAYAAIIHDYLYWYQTCTRADADKVFKHAMEDLGVEPSKIDLIYAAVRVGGESAWNTNKALRKAGEKRILVKYPESPAVTWASWKSKKDVLK